jgi:hypothetical protein
LHNVLNGLWENFGEIMKRLSVLLITILLLPFNISAMSTLSDSDLSNVSNPLSLSINPDQITEPDNTYLEAVDYSGISKFLLNTIKHGIVFNPVAHEDNNKIWETNAMGVPPFFFVLWDQKDSQIIIKNFLIDPITLKDTTAKVSAEDNIYNVTATPAGNTRTMYYPDGAVNSSSNSSTYTIRSGNTEMRDTYINQTRSTIQPNSWVDIKTR